QASCNRHRSFLARIHSESAARELRSSLIEERLHTFAEILAVDANFLNRPLFADGAGEIQCMRATEQPLRSCQRQWCSVGQLLGEGAGFFEHFGIGNDSIRQTQLDTTS